MTTLKNKLSICFCDVVDIKPLTDDYKSIETPISITPNKTFIKKSLCSFTDTVNCLSIEPTNKIKRFNIRNENERELLFNYFSAIPDIYKIKKTRKFWEEKRQEFIKKYNLNICLNAFTVKYSRYRRGYPDSD
jgi:hypothetical protein